MTYDEIDLLVDTDPLRLRDVAWGLEAENKALRKWADGLLHDLKLIAMDDLGPRARGILQQEYKIAVEALDKIGHSNV